MSRLDVLIYAHDGRGLGHASRSISIGMALRRLYPELKVLFVSGSAASRELTGTAPLDWLKLPSYKTEVVDGRSVGIKGNSNFSDQELGELRSSAISQIISLYRPRVALVDHTPQGKHKELLDALKLSTIDSTRWVLGVRGVMGAVAQSSSGLAREVYEKYYHSLLWYGDSSVLSRDHVRSLERHFSTTPIECGYVLRLAEIAYWKDNSLQQERRYAGTVSIPWLGEQSEAFLEKLAKAIVKIPHHYGLWQLFLEMDHSAETGQNISALFQNVENCVLQSPGSNYISALLHSKTALICGGYNSLMDVLFAKIPAVVVMREMQDEEQQTHLETLQSSIRGVFNTVSETAVQVDELAGLLIENLKRSQLPEVTINSRGAEKAADHIFSLLK